MKELYEQNKEDIIIAFEYAKLLVRSKKYIEAKQILLALTKTKNENFAKFELAKLEILLGNINQGRNILLSLIGTSNELFAKFELGKLEATLGNFEKAMEYFNEVINSGKRKDKTFAYLELGKILLLLLKMVLGSLLY